MIDNINDQRGSIESLATMMSVFDLSTSEDYESCATKLSLWYLWSGNNTFDGKMVGAIISKLYFLVPQCFF